MDDLLKWVLIAAGGLVVVALLGGIATYIAFSINPDLGESSFDPYTALGVSEEDVPDYEQIDGPGCSEVPLGTVCVADLLVPNAAETDARAAIADYLNRNLGADHVATRVVDEPDATVVMCQMRYAANERAAQVYMGATSDSYPLVEINCL